MDRIDALRLLLDVSEAGSFSSVARQRAIATSTVALAVSQLEQELGVSLMVRSTRKLVFTHEGELMLVDARRIVSEWDAALSGLREDGPLSGPIRITATNDFGRVRLRPLLDTFQQRHPGINVTLLLSDRAEDLIEEHIDLAIRSGPLPNSAMRARLLIRGRVWSARPPTTGAGRACRRIQASLRITIASFSLGRERRCLHGRSAMPGKS